MRSSSPTPTSRRRFMKLSAGGLALIPVVHLAGCSDDASQPARQAAPAAAPPATQPPAASKKAPPEAAAPPAETPEPSAMELVKLEESDPTAKALGYRHSTQDIDKAQYARHQTVQICGNCNLYQAGAGSDTQWGGCSIFPGKLVSLNGWCNAYIAKA